MRRRSERGFPRRNGQNLFKNSINGSLTPGKPNQPAPCRGRSGGGANVDGDYQREGQRKFWGPVGRGVMICLY